MCGSKPKPDDWCLEQIASDLLDPLGTATAPTTDKAKDPKHKEGER